MVTDQINWRATHAQALGESQGTGRLVLVDLFSPT